MGRKEEANYTREGFGTASGTGEYFLARMRRTNETFDPAIADGTGGAVPYLFGRGTAMPSKYKAEGIPVRAAAIAEGRPVMSLGADESGEYHRGTFAIPKNLWELNLNGASISPAGDVRDASNNLLGNAKLVSRSEVLVIGDALDPAAAEITAGTWYVPSFVTTSMNVERVIGFGCLHVDEDTFAITKRLNQIASENASAVLTQKLEPVGNELDEVLECFRVHSIASDGMLVPALAR